MKSLEELNREFQNSHCLTSTECSAEQPPAERIPPGKPGPLNRIKRRGLWIAAGAVCMIFLCIMILPGILGLSWYHVDSGSMEDMIPKGSLIIDVRKDPSEIRPGDVITFLNAEGKSVTHQVTAVYKDIGGSYSYGFETKGTNNSVADYYYVVGEQIQGVVWVYVPGLGQALNIAGQCILFAVLGLLTLLILYVIISFMLKKNISTQYKGSVSFE